MVYFKTKNPAFTNEVLEKAEQYRQSIEKKWKSPRHFNWPWSKKRYQIYLFENQKAYQKAAKRPIWSKASATYGPEKVILGFQRSESFLDSELPHEIAHIVFREMLGAESRSVPLWVDEGVALLEERSGKNKLDQVLLDAVKSNRWIPLSRLNQVHDMRKMSMKSATLFYAESKSLVGYLYKRFGREAFIRFCLCLRDGKSLGEALEKAFGASYSRPGFLEREWLSYIQRI